MRHYHYPRYYSKYMMALALLSITIIIFILMIGMVISTPSHISLIHITYAKNKSANNNVNNYGGSGDNNNIANQDQSNIAAINNKVVILTFGDIHKSQYMTAKPILDQYGFKGSFFVT